jgi:cytosine/adenosine deaminase-related metal-dependent hydrolase
LSERTVRIVARDLFFRAKLEAVARRAGWSVSPSGPAALAVVELAGHSSLKLIDELVSSGVSVLAFGPHVEAELLRAARQKGAEAVPNSRVEGRLEELLSQKKATGRGS